jgi:hypothetical protein
MVDELQDWSAPIREFQDLYSGFHSEVSLVSGMSAMSVVQHTDLILPPSPSPETTLFYHQLVGLTRMAMHVNAVDINNVFANLQMVGYTFSSLSRGHWGDIDDFSGLEQVMVQYESSPTSHSQLLIYSTQTRHCHCHSRLPDQAVSEERERNTQEHEVLLHACRLYLSHSPPPAEKTHFQENSTRLSHLCELPDCHDSPIAK